MGEKEEIYTCPWRSFEIFQNRNILLGELGPSKAVDQLLGGDGAGAVCEARCIGQDADELLGAVAAQKGGEVKVCLSLTETSSVRGDQKGDMDEFWHREAQPLIKPDLSGGGIQKVSASDHLRDPSQSIVHHHGELIGIDSVGSAEDKISAGLGRDLLL
jgi:hypothetical protein